VYNLKRLERYSGDTGDLEKVFDLIGSILLMDVDQGGVFGLLLGNIFDTNCFAISLGTKKQ
jgi:hypothetical protein